MLIHLVIILSLLTCLVPGIVLGSRVVRICFQEGHSFGSGVMEVDGKTKGSKELLHCRECQNMDKNKVKEEISSSGERVQKDLIEEVTFGLNYRR